MWASSERLPAVEEEEVDVYRRTDHAGAGAAVASCWGRLGLAALWHRLRQLSVARRRRPHGRSILGAGGLNYDPLSYAQNFDDGASGGLEECEPAFSARFAPARQVGALKPAPPVTS